MGIALLNLLNDIAYLYLLYKINTFLLTKCLTLFIHLDIKETRTGYFAKLNRGERICRIIAHSEIAQSTWFAQLRSSQDVFRYVGQ